MEEHVALSTVPSQNAKDKTKMKQLFLYVKLIQNNINESTVIRIARCVKTGKNLVILSINLWSKERGRFSTAINEAALLCCTIQLAVTNPTAFIDRGISIPCHGFLHCGEMQGRAHPSKCMTLRKLESFSKKQTNPTS